MTKPSKIKVCLFNFVTYIISFINFNFNMLIGMLFSQVCGMDDDKIPAVLMTQYKSPINVIYASAIQTRQRTQRTECTNKINMLLNYHWDCEFYGVNISTFSHIVYDHIVLFYIDRSGVRRRMLISKKNQTVNGEYIDFGELSFK